MKIETINAFKPITITVETPDEIALLDDILRIAGNELYKTPEKSAVFVGAASELELISKIRKGLNK